MPLIGWAHSHYWAGEEAPPPPPPTAFVPDSAFRRGRSRGILWWLVFLPGLLG